MSDAIQKAAPGVLDLLVTPTWPREVLEVVRRLKCPKGISDEEFYVFCKQCQQSGLNPLLGHAYCVPRRTNVAPKGQPAQWVTNHVFQPAIDGMRARAAEFPDFISTNGAPVYENDLITLDRGKGEVIHKANPVKPGRLVGAWGRVEKRGAIPIVTWLPVSARSGDSSFWTADPGGMLAKCAEAAALRKAYPVAFGGMHIREEMPDDTGSGTRAEAVLRPVQGEVPPAPETKALPTPTGPVVQFGKFKNTPIEVMAEDDRRAAIEEGEWWLRENPKARAGVKKALEENLSQLRESLGAATPQPEGVEEATFTEGEDVPDGEPPPDVELPTADGRRVKGSP